MSDDKKASSGPDPAVLKALQSMSTEQIAKTAVQAGIYTTDGKLTEPYRAPKK